MSNRVDETILVKELSSVRLLNSFLYGMFKKIEFNNIENYRYIRNNLVYNEVEASDTNQSYYKDKIIGVLDHFYNVESSILNA